MKMPREIIELERTGLIRAQDFHFAEFIGRACGHYEPNLLLAAAIVSHAVAKGDICLDLTRPRPGILPADETPAAETSRLPPALRLPDGGTWRRALLHPGARACVAQPGEAPVKPLMLDGHRLYLYRYWRYEHDAFERLREMSLAVEDFAITPALAAGMDQWFAVPPAHRDDAALPAALRTQRQAAQTILQRRLTLISGGPGTGKTHTIARAILLLAGCHQDRRPPRIRLAAPTGKAAARMLDSIRRAAQDLPLDGEIRRLIPDSAATIHRLLGSRPDSPYFRHDAHNPLEADIVILDEASMIDLPLMAKLLAALPPDARLVMLGDMHQLASVEPGHVFGDICRAPCMRAALVELDYSLRFPPQSAVGLAGRAITSGDARAAWDAINRDDLPAPRIRQHDAPDDLYDRHHRPLPPLRQALLDGYRDYLAAATIGAAFKAFDNFRVLCAGNHGRHGARQLNRMIEDILARPDGVGIPGLETADHEFYIRRPVLITRNDYAQSLFNGDIGIVAHDPDGRLAPADDHTPIGHTGGRRVAYFERRAPDGSRAYAPIPVNMLPPHETAFAMTVHKSQGSEFDRMLIIIPPRDHELLTRELLYTAVTRARAEVTLWCRRQVFDAMIKRQTMRITGMAAPGAAT